MSLSLAQLSPSLFFIANLSPQLQIGRRPQLLSDGRRPQLFGKMEDNLNFLEKWKTTSIFMGYGRQPQLLGKWKTT
jgi:hypothetical protein